MALPAQHSVEEKKINGSAVPRYKVNLDAAPEERWQEIIADYKQHFQQIEKVITDIIANELGKSGLILKSVVSSLMSGVTKCGAVYYAQELKAIAKQSNMDLGLLVLMQLIYEASAHCTSIVCHDGNGNPIHVRTMDWEMPFLRPLTVEIEFYRAQKLQCVATSWAGYVGILTGMRCGADGFSVAVNFRVNGDGFWQNFKKALSGSWPIGCLVRHVLTNEESMTFDAACSAFKKSPLIAPVYFTMSGSRPGQGCLITRHRETHEKCLVLKTVADNDDESESKTATDATAAKAEEEEEEEEREFLVQTNIDHWSTYWADNIMWSIQRRREASEQLQNVNGKCDYAALWKLINEHPIVNDITVYGTLMSVHDGYLETRLPHKRYGFVKENISDDDDDDDEEEWHTCTHCGAKYHEALNVAGECRHSGSWHSAFGDCDKLKCAMGLGSKIGQQHWSCCYAVAHHSTRTCPKSGKHEPFKRPVKLNVAELIGIKNPPIAETR